MAQKKDPLKSRTTGQNTWRSQTRGTTKDRSKTSLPAEVKDDKRLEVSLKPESIKAVIEQVKHNCQALLKPSTPTDKEIAMKIKRAVAVPG